MNIKLVAVLCTFCITFAIYLFTLAPGAYWRDSTEFVHASYALDITHPSGSPIFLHAAKFLEFLPIGSIAFRANFTSALFTAIGVGLLALLLMIIAEDVGFVRLECTICASALAVWFGFSGAVWEWALAAEVYGLNLVFLTLVFVAAWLAEKTLDKTIGAILAFLTAFGVGIHPTFIFFIPVVAIFLLILTLHSKRRISSIAIFAFAGMLGCLVVFYAFFRSHANPLEDYGDPQTLNMFISYITGRSVQSRILDYSLLCGLNNLVGILKYFAKEFLYLPLILAIVGIIYLALKRPNYLLLTLGLAITNWYSVKDWIAPFGYIPLIFSLVLLSWLGFIKLILSVQRAQNLLAYLKPVVTSVLIGAMITCFAKNLHTYERHTHALAETHGYNMFTSMPYGSIFLINHGPTIFLSLYQQFVLGYRQDIEVIPEPYLFHPEGLAQRHARLMEGYTSPDVDAVASWLKQQSKTRGLFVNNPGALEKLLNQYCNIEGPFVFSCNFSFVRGFNPLAIISKYASYPYYERDYSAKQLTSSYAEMLGIIAYKKGNRDETKQWFYLSTLLTEHEPTGAYNLAQIEMADGNCDAAIEHAYEAYSRKRCYPLTNPIELLCRTLYSCKKFEQAKIKCQEAIRLNPQSEMSRYFYAMSLLLTNERAQGVKHLEKIFWSSCDSRLITSSGLILLELNHFHEQKRDKACERLMKTAPEDNNVRRFCAQGKTS